MTWLNSSILALYQRRHCYSQQSTTPTGRDRADHYWFLTPCHKAEAKDWVASHLHQAGGRWDPIQVNLFQGAALGHLTWKNRRGGTWWLRELQLKSLHGKRKKREQGHHNTNFDSLKVDRWKFSDRQMTVFWPTYPDGREMSQQILSPQEDM